MKRLCDSQVFTILRNTPIRVYCAKRFAKTLQDCEVTVEYCQQCPIKQLTNEEEISFEALNKTVKLKRVSQTSKPITPKPITPKPITPKPITSKTITPKTITPKTITPKSSTVTSWIHVSDNLEITLPTATENDRPVRFNEDGSIEYLDADNWEPPRSISNFQRDENNNRRFLPLIQPCALRHQQAIRYQNCGCINVKFICNNPNCKSFTQVVTYNICNICEWRKP
jgi:UDP:flavonoid glycosyltransferase YjiC (YdhE family)